MFVVDTNVLSELRRPQADPQVLAWFGRRSPLDMYVSAITVYELEIGVRRVERRDQQQGKRLRRWLVVGVLEQFRGRILAVDEAVARCAASLQVPDPRPERDCLIAATAAVHAMAVVTRNVRDFQPLGIDVINPWETES